MLLLGLTGNIACGKSAVAKQLGTFGAATLDADLLVRELYDDVDFSSQVADLFPTSLVRNAQKTVDRVALGRLVFDNPYALRRLEAVVHPAVAALRARKLTELRQAATPPVCAVLEAVKLIESGQADECDFVWCVTCSRDVQLARLMNARGLSESEANARLDAQPPMEPKIARLERLGVPLIVIENNGTIEELQARVKQEWTRICGD